MNYVSLFAGIGGFDLALNRLEHKCVYVNEWDKYAAILMRKTSGIDPIQDQLEMFSSKTFLRMSFSLVGFLAKVSRLLESEEDFKIREALCFLKSLELSMIENLHIYSLRTSKDSSAMIRAIPLRQSSQPLMNWGMTVNGRCVTASISEFRKTGKESILSDILEENPDQKYFLSIQKQKQILKGMKSSLTSNLKEQKLLGKQEQFRPDIIKDTQPEMGKTQAFLLELYEPLLMEKDSGK